LLISEYQTTESRDLFADWVSAKY